MQQTPGSRRAMALVAAIAWFGVLLQLGLSVKLALDNGKTITDGLIAYFAYFTVLTNVFVALATSLPLVAGDTRAGRWFGSDMVLGCATAAIVLVGIAYHLLLRHVWSPEGWQWAADMTLHYAVPLSLASCWVAFPPRRRLPLLAPLFWCAYPAFYFAYALVRGAWLGTYPYHFIDVTTLGYPKVFINAAGLLAGFLIVGALVLGIARLRRPWGEVT